MKYKQSIVILIFLLFLGCDQYKNQSSKISLKIEKKYNNSGFSLIYDESLNIKKLDNRSLQIFHKSLKNKSHVKITNPLNNKFLIAEVKSNKIKFSDFYNSIISKRIAENLDLNPNEPYVEIVLISRNSTFIAKKAKTFDEEKKVANKAPVNNISINDLNEVTTHKKKSSNKKFSYTIKIADFYFSKTALEMIKRIKKETLIKNPKILKISDKKYRVFLGPFNDINTLQKSFNDINILEFDNIEIIKND